MHVGATHVSANFSRGLVHNFYERLVVHLMEGLVVPDLNDTKCDPERKTRLVGRSRGIHVNIYKT